VYVTLLIKLSGGTSYDISCPYLLSVIGRQPSWWCWYITCCLLHDFVSDWLLLCYWRSICTGLQFYLEEFSKLFITTLVMMRKLANCSHQLHSNVFLSHTDPSVCRPSLSIFWSGLIVYMHWILHELSSWWLKIFIYTYKLINLITAVL